MRYNPSFIILLTFPSTTKISYNDVPGAMAQSDLCTIFGSHEGTVDLKYNLIATLNHKASKKNDCHNTAMNKSPTSRSWYKYDDDIVNLVNFVKGNTNSMLMDFQKTASILFYVNVRYVSVCHSNLCSNNEVIDITGHERPPIMISYRTPPHPCC
jgi:hypothetical protein